MFSSLHDVSWFPGVGVKEGDLGGTREDQQMDGMQNV